MPELTPQQKAQLDKNIKAMLAQGASEDDVMSYATDFRNKYDVKKKEPSPVSGVGSIGSVSAIGSQVGASGVPSTGIELDPNDPLKSALNPIRNNIAEQRSVPVAESTGQSAAQKFAQSNRTNALLVQKSQLEKWQFGNAVQAEDFVKSKLDPAKLVSNKPLDMTRQPTLDDYTIESITEALPKDNETAQKGVEKYLKNRWVREDLSTSENLEEAAVKNAMRKNGIVGQRAEELKGNVPPSMKSNLLANFINDDDVRELAEKNPQLAQDISEEVYNFPQRNPVAAMTMLSEIISAKREELGENRGILNITSAKTSDKIIDDLVESGELPIQYKNLYDIPAVRFYVNRNLKTPGLVENFGEGLSQGLIMLGKSVADITQIRKLYSSKEDRLFNTIEKDYQNFQLKPKGLMHQITTHGGLITGQVIPMMAGGAGLRAANLVKGDVTATILMAGLQTFGENRDRALADLPGASEAEQLGYATINTGIEMALAPIFNDVKLARNLMKGVAPEVKGVIKKFTSKEITEAAAKQEVNNIFSKALAIGGKFAKGTVKTAEREAREEGATQLLQTANNQVFGGEPQSLTKQFQDAFEVYQTTFLGSLFLGVGGGVVELNRNPEMGKLLSNMALNPERYVEIMKGEAALNQEYAKDIDSKLDNLQYVVDVRKELDETTQLPENAKDKFLLKSLSEKILKEKVAATPDKSLSKQTEKKIAEIEIEKEKVLNPEMTNTELVKEFFENDLLGKSSKENLSIRDEAGNPTNKFDESKVGEYIKEAAQRLNNLDGGWKPNKVGDSSEAAKSAYPEAIQEIANERWAKEIEAAQPKIDQDRELEFEPEVELGVSVIRPEENVPPNVVPLVTTEAPPQEPAKTTVSDAEALPVGDAAKPVIVETVDTSVVQKQMKPITDKMAEIEMQFSNEGFKIDWDYDAEIAITDKSGEFVEPNELPESLKKLAADYEAATTKLSNFDHSSFVQSLEASRKLISGEDAVFEVVGKTELPPAEPPQATPKAEEGGSQRPPGEPVAPKEVTESEIKQGITHAANEVRRKDRKLADYQRQPETFEQWNNEAEQKLKDGYDVDKLMDRIEAGHDPTPVENAIRKIYVATLDGEILKNPTDELLARQKRFIEVGDLANSRAGRNLASLKGVGSPLESISDFYVARMEALGSNKLTEQQKRETQQVFEAVQKADANAEKVLQEYAEQIAKLKAENELLRHKKAAGKPAKPKTSEDFKKERQSYREELKKAKEKHEQWLKDQNIKKSGGGFTLTTEMAKIIGKIAKSYVDEGIVRLEDVIQKALDEIKDIFPEVDAMDIRDVLAGEYNEARPTRDELTAKWRDLKDEAYYINKLEKLLSGEEPTKEKERVKRNQRITELQDKISEFRKSEREKEMPSDLKKLETLRKKNEAEAEKTKERIKAADFAPKKPVPFLEDPELQKKFPQKYKEVLDAIHKREEARHEFDIALLKDQMSKRTFFKKYGIDLTGDIIGTTKALVTGIDASGIGIQNLVAMISHPRSAMIALPRSFTDFVSAQNQQRWLTSVHSSKLYPLAQKAGLDITEPQSLKASEREEIFTHNLLDRAIKYKGKKYVISKYITKPFERIFVGLGNRMRWNLWQRGVSKLQEQGYTWENHPEEYTSLAKVLNTETGRGKLHPQVDKAFNLISAGIWSPRLMASRMNILGIGDLGNLIAGGKKGYYGGLTPKMRTYALGDLAKFVVFGTMFMGLAGMTFADDVDLDPNSSTFGTFLVDGKRYNIWGGFTQYVRLIATYIAGGEKKSDGTFTKTAPADKTLRFLWSKTTPAVGTGISLMRKGQRDYMGQPVTPMGALENLTIPLSIRGIVNGIEQEGGGSVLWTGVPSFVGTNVSYQSDFEDKKTPQTKPERQKPERPKREKMQ